MPKVRSTISTLHIKNAVVHKENSDLVTGSCKDIIAAILGFPCPRKVMLVVHTYSRLNCLIKL